MQTVNDQGADAFTDFAVAVSRNWTFFVLRGVVALVLAGLAFWMPAQYLLALTVLFGAFSFVDGVFSIAAAVRNMRAEDRWGWLMASGVLGVLTGIVVIVSPLVATFVLATFLWASIAFWTVTSGVLELLAAIRLRKVIEGEFWLGLSGAISIALGLAVVWMLFANPMETFLALGWLLGLYAAIFGVVMILLGLRLRKLAD